MPELRRRAAPTAATAASRSSGIAAAEEAVGSIRPSTTWASVIVGVVAAAAVAGRPRARAGAARADAEGAAVVDVGDRAAAGADRVHVEHRHEQRVAADPGVPRGCLADAPLGDDPDVGRRAAHVERDQPAAAGRAAPAHWPPRMPAAGPGQQQGRPGVSAAACDARDAAVRHHHVEVAVGRPRSLERGLRAAPGSGPVFGPTNAFMQAVVKRSNSRNCGTMSALVVTNAPGHLLARRSAAARRSCSGFR